MKVYEHVRTYIVENGLDPDVIAKRADIPTGTFRKLLSGERILYADDLRAICLALDVSPEMFLKIS